MPGHAALCDVVRRRLFSPPGGFSDTAEMIRNPRLRTLQQLALPPNAACVNFDKRGFWLRRLFRGSDAAPARGPFIPRRVIGAAEPREHSDGGVVLLRISRRVKREIVAVGLVGKQRL